MNDFRNKVAVITGAAGGLGREFANVGAALGMKLVLADIQPDALEKTEQELKSIGADVQVVLCDVRNGEQVQLLAETTMTAHGAIHLLFNNAGVGMGGLIWEHTQADWEWILDVNLWGVIHGMRIFTPLMLECAKNDAGYAGHIVNTASMAGLVNVPAMGAYNVSKHAVVSLTESLYHDLQLVNAPVGASVLCPYYVPTGISHSERNRPDEMPGQSTPTASQRMARELIAKAVAAGKIPAAQVAAQTFDAIREGMFYIYTHPAALAGVQMRFEDILLRRNPVDPYRDAPQIREMMLRRLKED